MATVETLEIAVAHSASGAAGEISSVANALHDLYSQIGRVLPSLKELADTLSGIKSDININIQNTGAEGVKQQYQSSANPSEWAKEMADMVESKDKGFLANIKEVMGQGGSDSALQDAASSAEEAQGIISGAVGKIKSDIASVKGAFQTLADGIKGYFDLIKMELGSFKSLVSSAFKGVSGIAKGITAPFKALGKSAKDSLAPVTSLLRAIGRIAFYRLIRSAIKAVTDAFREGLKEAYTFSAGIEGESHRFAAAMDSMSASGNIMKGQLGSAFIGLLAAIAPIVNAIIGLVTRLAAALSQLFGAFTGGTWLKATGAAEGLEEACGGGAAAAEEWKNQLMGFDEINRLEEPNDGGGGGGGGANALKTMFEEAKVDEAIQKFVDDLKAAINAGDWKGAGELIGNKINELLPPKEKWTEWGQKLGYGLNGAVSTLYWTLRTINWRGIGESIAAFINATLGEIDASTWGALLVEKFIIALEFLIGFLGELDFGQLGEKIGEFLRGALDRATEWLAEQDWSKIGQDLSDKITELLEYINFDSLADSFFTFLGTAFGAAVLLIGSFFEDSIQAVKDYFKEKMEEAGGDAWEGFKNGISEALKNIVEWCDEHIVTPFVTAVKNLLGIASPSTVMAKIGSDTAEGFKSGFETKWNEFKTSCETLWNDFKTWWENRVLPKWNIKVPKINIEWTEAGELFKFFGFSRVPRLSVSWSEFANGGFPEDGLFFANHGELVGQFSNGKTAVANNEQIIEGIKQGVIEAMMIANSGGNGRGVTEVRMDVNGREFMRAVFEDGRAVANEHGISLITA